ncbi:Hsp33 family molecular chaperone HslO [Sphingosinicella sp. BN140058]|uniref:Hsp33 family molecular chaperone HslO n=1 Tax=Sphingosinicella sp. BN140058 TaxID=1892855 RepID=UPI001011371A|nr:Hsp33 family molecular chaperone HslO [Sphingosinicella sp. BN140058]QAY79607.1 Hsp33 family molecular chaperone HslO [Sphingosinicella sp. BN140058]
MTSSQTQTAATAANLDEAIGFTIPARNARGRIVRLGPLLDLVLSAHDYPAPIARILSEALVLAALLGSLLKDDQGQLTIQAQTEAGIIDLLVVDYRGGELRGYVRFDKERLAQLPSHRDLFALFGKGYLAITFDLPRADERYQGIVPLEGSSLAEAAQSYFSQSEQLPSVIRLAVNDTGHVAGGMLVQHLPEGEEGRDRLHTRLDDPEWEHVRILSETIKGSELADAELPLREVLWRLFHEEDVRVLNAQPLAKGCRCNFDYIKSVISRFAPQERAEMVDEDGFISVDCEFCSRVFPISLSDFHD